MNAKLNLNEWTPSGRASIDRAYPPRSVTIVLAQLVERALRKMWATHVQNIDRFGEPAFGL